MLQIPRQSGMPTHQASSIIVTVYDKGTVMQDASPLCALIDYKK